MTVFKSVWQNMHTHDRSSSLLLLEEDASVGPHICLIICVYGDTFHTDSLCSHAGKIFWLVQHLKSTEQHSTSLHTKHNGRHGLGDSGNYLPHHYGVNAIHKTLWGCEMSSRRDIAPHSHSNDINSTANAEV